MIKSSFTFSGKSLVFAFAGLLKSWMATMVNASRRDPVKGTNIQIQEFSLARVARRANLYNEEGTATHYT